MDAMNGTSDLSIGGGNDPNDQYRGIIDEVKFYNYARSSAQVAWSYNKGDAILYYKMDECSGTTINDSGATAINATLTIGASGTQTASGNCSGGASSDAWYNGSTGKRNSSISLDGTDDYIATANTPIMTLDTLTYNDLSWSAWVYPTTTPSSDLIVEKNNEFRITTDANGIPLCSINNGSWSDIATTATALPINTWTQIICTYNGTDLKMYINSVEKGSSSLSTTITSTSTTPLNIGRSAAASGYFTGRIDDVKVYSYALNPLLVRAAYGSGSVQFGN
jgi:hypothetical protein